MSSRRLRVAIDGPSGAGKSTIAKIVARELGYLYLDTGAMYRAVTLAALRRGLSFDGDGSSIATLAENLRIDLAPAGPNSSGPTVMVDGEPVTDQIRSPEVGRHVSLTAAIPGVRRALVRRQREIAGQGGAVLDGRDIGTAVLPEAEVKVFLTASLDERARRRLKEQLGRGFGVTFDEVRNELAERDRIDTSRQMDPLRQADDAVLLDSTGMTIEEVAAEVMKLCRQAAGRLERAEAPRAGTPETAGYPATPERKEGL